MSTEQDKKPPYIEEQLGETEMGVPTGASYVPDKITDFDKPFKCIHCHEYFDELTDSRPNECRTAYRHVIVRVKSLERIILKRGMIFHGKK